MPRASIGRHAGLLGRGSLCVCVASVPCKVRRRRLVATTPVKRPTFNSACRRIFQSTEYAASPSARPCTFLPETDPPHEARSGVTRKDSSALSTRSLSLSILYISSTNVLCSSLASYRRSQ
ncbi:hypothetical protein DENSPDRAFT_839843 [Dentipellis sp. KUC8613]|nr:hypothetical protein DENSPDRAFT_839843 [Dentipellis sp. KUC8613]